MNTCESCKPVNSLANFQYYARDELPADIQAVFNSASMFDLMIVAISRATRITQLFSKKKGVEVTNCRNAMSQRYSQGNIAIYAQDVTSVQDVLPPLRSEISETMCALYIGAQTVPTEDNIRKLGPVLISMTCIEFADVCFSPENLSDLLKKDADDQDIGVPQGAELSYLPDEHHGPGSLDPDTVIMEAMGYTAGEHTPQDYKNMKASAVAWCLDKKNFIQMQTSSKFIPDRDPSLLTFTFLHLDPWCIKGFHEPNRSNYPNFAFVCWNIMQKKEVNKHVSFGTDTLMQATIVSKK
ncbi:hypothetical protein B0H10DRAFT_2166596 [Mycena sp. CBHHK59/15]|nr:hypothetical protein B0H10DRAFT_2166596 [Mycena sp. CBHHK59/15]